MARAGPLAQAMRLKSAAGHAELQKIQEQLNHAQADLASRNSDAMSASSRAEAAIAQLDAARTEAREFANSQIRAQATQEARWRAEVAQADEAAEEARLECLATRSSLQVAQAECARASESEAARRRIEQDASNLRRALEQAERSVETSSRERASAEAEAAAALNLERDLTKRAESGAEEISEQLAVAVARGDVLNQELRDANDSGAEQLESSNCKLRTVEGELLAAEARSAEVLELVRNEYHESQSELAAARASRHFGFRKTLSSVEGQPKCTCSLQ